MRPVAKSARILIKFVVGECARGRGVKLITHFLLVPRSKN